MLPKIRCSNSEQRKRTQTTQGFIQAFHVAQHLSIRSRKSMQQQLAALLSNTATVLSAQVAHHHRSANSPLSTSRSCFASSVHRHISTRPALQEAA
eukprot:3047444-Amphidinium_carterae.1